MTKKGGKTRRIYFKIESYEPDHVQYKPAKPLIRPIELYTYLDIPEIYFADVSGLPRVSNCLTEKGFRKLREVLSGREKF